MDKLKQIFWSYFRLVLSGMVISTIVFALYSLMITSKTAQAIANVAVVALTVFLASLVTAIVTANTLAKNRKRDRDSNLRLTPMPETLTVNLLSLLVKTVNSIIWMLPSEWAARIDGHRGRLRQV